MASCSSPVVQHISSTSTTDSGSLSAQVTATSTSCMGSQSSGDGKSISARSFDPSFVLLGRENNEARENLIANHLEGVKVKNTFIDGFDDDEDEDLPAMTAVKSCPPRSMYLAKSPAGPGPASLLAAVDEGADDHEQAATGAFDSTPMPDSTPVQLGGGERFSPDTTSQAVNDTLETRQPSVSVGSQLHGTGECRPCAWFWRPQGCTNGVECRHCHLCPAGEVKSRRKNKIATMRTRKPEHTGPGSNDHPSNGQASLSKPAPLRLTMLV